MFAEESCVLSLEKRGLWFKTFPGRKKKKRKKRVTFIARWFLSLSSRLRGTRGWCSLAPQVLRSPLAWLDLQHYVPPCRFIFPKVGSPHKANAIKLSNHPSSYFHHIPCPFWQRYREQLLKEDLKPKQLNLSPSLDHAASTLDTLPSWLPEFAYTAEDQF